MSADSMRCCVLMWLDFLYGWLFERSAGFVLFFGWFFEGYYSCSIELGIVLCHIFLVHKCGS